MLAAKRSAAEGRVIAIDSDFPTLDYSGWWDGDDSAGRRQHDPRSS
jgi:hypothetical protein